MFRLGGDMTKRRTFIYCPRDHVIGEIVNKDLNGEKVSALYVYEKSVLETTVTEELPVKRCILLGDALEIECTICRQARDWTISNKTAVAMMVGLLNSLYEPAKRKDMVNHEPT
jgi:hypothetical protein